jgi:hypothetical protein
LLPFVPRVLVLVLCVPLLQRLNRRICTQLLSVLRLLLLQLLLLQLLKVHALHEGWHGYVWHHDRQHRLVWMLRARGLHRFSAKALLAGCGKRCSRYRGQDLLDVFIFHPAGCILLQAGTG